MLLQNKTIYSQYPCRFSGGATGNELSQSCGLRLETNMNRYVGFANMNCTVGIPDGYGLHTGWGKRRTLYGNKVSITSSKQSLMSLGTIKQTPRNLSGLKRAISLILNSSEILNSSIIAKSYIIAIALGEGKIERENLSGLVRLELNINSSSEIVESVVNIIASIQSHIYNSVTNDIDVTASTNIFSNIEGNSIIYIENIKGLRRIISTILSSSELKRAELKGKGNVSSNVFMGAVIDPLSPKSLADAIWMSLATEFNVENTMGGKLNSASVGGIDYNTLRETIWSASKNNYLDENTIGGIINKINHDTSLLRNYDDSIIRENLNIIKKLNNNKIVRNGNIITIYNDDNVTVWRRYDISNKGRILI